MKNKLLLIKRRGYSKTFFTGKKGEKEGLEGGEIN